MQEKSENIQRLWKESFGDCPPVTYLFKYRLFDRWFRIHSLPKSKRYADNEAETNILLYRQNTVLLDVIGDQSERALFCGSYDSQPLEENFKLCSALSKYNFQVFARLSKQDFNPDELELDEEPPYLSLFFALDNPKASSLDEILLCVADEKIYNFFVVDFEQQHIFAPYDGGVDIILRDSQERDQLKHKYEDWLSNHPEGL